MSLDLLLKQLSTPGLKLLHKIHGGEPPSSAAETDNDPEIKRIQRM